MASLILGIEGTAHTLGVGMVDASGNILADVNDSFIPPEGKGLVPADVARHHSAKLPALIKQALDLAGAGARDIAAMAYSRGPGFTSCLRNVAVGARALARALDVPLLGVNHLAAHVEMAKLRSGMADPVVVTVSGGTTQVVVWLGGQYRIMGETLDIAIGNCYDKFARELGVREADKPWGGPMIDKLALEGGRLYDVPYSVKGMDVQFSGILTYLTSKLKEGAPPEDLCYSLQETSLAMVVEVAERAMGVTGKKELLLTGGFARNKRLQDMMDSMANQREASFAVVDAEFASDNGVMIAWGGAVMLQRGETTPLGDSGVRPKWRVDQA